MLRPIRIVPAILLVASAVHSGEAEAPVQVRDFNIQPMGNLAYANGTLTVHPKAMLTVGSDSNIYATEKNVKDDQYVGGLVGVEARYAASEALTAALDLQLRADHYFNEDDRDMVGGTGALNVDWKGEVATAGVALDYARFDDPLVQTGEKVLRENLDGVGYAGWQGPSYNGRLGLGGRSVQYLEDVGGFEADQRSYTGALADLRVGMLGGEETETYGTVKYSSWAYEDNTLLNDGSQVSATVGWRTTLGGRTKLVLEGGVDMRSYDKESGPGADDKDVVLPVATVLLAWPWSERSELSGRLYAQADNSLTSNAYQLTGAQVGVRWGATDQTIVFASVDGMQIADTAAATGQDEEIRTTGILSLGAEYTAVQGLAFRLTGRQTMSDAKVATSSDYDRTEVILDTVFAF